MREATARVLLSMSLPLDEFPGVRVERMVDTSFLNNPYLVLNLNQGDFSTAYRVSEAINEFLDDTSIATPIDGTSVR